MLWLLEERIFRKHSFDIFFISRVVIYTNVWHSFTARDELLRICCDIWVYKSCETTLRCSWMNILLKMWLAIHFIKYKNGINSFCHNSFRYDTTCWLRYVDIQDVFHRRLYEHVRWLPIFCLKRRYCRNLHINWGIAKYWRYT